MHGTGTNQIAQVCLIMLADVRNDWQDVEDINTLFA